MLFVINRGEPSERVNKHSVYGTSRRIVDRNCKLRCGKILVCKRKGEPVNQEVKGVNLTLAGSLHTVNILQSIGMIERPVVVTLLDKEVPLQWRAFEEVAGWNGKVIV